MTVAGADFQNNGWLGPAFPNGYVEQTDVGVSTKVASPGSQIWNNFQLTPDDDIPGAATVVADFNQDGLMDYAVATQTAYEIDVYINQGTPVPSFKVNRIPAGLTGGNTGACAGAQPPLPVIAAGDFNGDGLPDIAIGVTCSSAGLPGPTGGGRGIVVFLNDVADAAGVPTPGNFWDPANNTYDTTFFETDILGRSQGMTNAGEYTGLVATDVDGDGNLDLVASLVSATNGAWPAGTTSTIAVYPGKGNGTFSGETYFKNPGYPLAAQPQPYGLAVGDLNGDGKVDIALVNAGAANNLDVYLNTCN